MKTLLVIGGSGFFGKSILDAYSRGLLNPWDVSKVIVMSRNAEKLLDELPELVGKGVELYSADITKTDSLPAADYVIHAAASTDLRNYLLAPEEEKRNIQTGTYHYCELVKKYHSKSKIVYVSSGAVYGAQPSLLNKVDETYVGNLSEMPPGKLDYAIAKQDAEKAIFKLGQSGISVSIARCFAFVGPWLPRSQHFAIGNFIENVLEVRAIKVNASRKVYRSYMYADDLVEWLMTIVEAATPSCPVYNVGSDEAILLTDLAERMAVFYGVDCETKPIEEPEVDRYIPDISKAKKELGLRLKIDLENAIDLTIKAIKLHA